VEAEPAAEDVEVEDADAIHYTRTMAELFVRQGLHARALDILRHLLRRDPGNEVVRARVVELEERLAAEEEIPGPTWSPPRSAPGRRAIAPEQAPPPEPPPHEEPRTASLADESVAEYLRRLLAWPSRRGGGDRGGDEPREGGW
jgi:hypothetical protein